MIAPQWQQVELAFDLVGGAPAHPYIDVEAQVVFTHDSGERLRRPVFWDGGTAYAVRFASTRPDGVWSWRVESPGYPLAPTDGTLAAAPPDADAVHPALRHGFLRRTDGARALTYADGSAHLVVADTAWALPWRATPEQVQVYAADRQAKGFTAVLLMSVQPDMRAAGPDARGTDLGFRVAFGDLAAGRLTDLRVDYFRELDATVATLRAHGLTPVLQPVFFGFGWKGLEVAGPVLPADDYARYCRYLVARYGAGPVVYLVGADGSGHEPQVQAGGEEIRRTDAYGQPTGLHYRPHSTADAHQGADWVDFQWCQTGHEGDHVPDRVATMWRNVPARPVMNGEPTYEHSGRTGKGAGWWQGHEAWSNLCAGAVMGVAYGAGSLWQWKLGPDEPGHEPFFAAPGAGWREALDFEGSTYVGQVGKILAGLRTDRLAPCWDVALTTRGLLDPGVLYIGYAEHGGRWVFLDADGRVPSPWWLVDPRTGAVLAAGVRTDERAVIDDDSTEPRVIICAATTPPGLATGAPPTG